jgi:serine/threonine-protein kinase
MAGKANVYQAQGKLQEAAKLLSGVNEETPGSSGEFKICQLRLERNYSEAIRILQAQLAHPFASQLGKAMTQLGLAHMQLLAGDKAGAKATAKQGRNILEQLSKNQPDNWVITEKLSQLCAIMGDKDLALSAAQRAIALVSRRLKRADVAPGLEENLAFIQMIFGDKRSAIAILTRLSKTPYDSRFHAGPITPALLRIDPIWDSLRSDPDFQKLCQEKQ